jgi:hypothetical protein
MQDHYSLPPSSWKEYERSLNVQTVLLHGSSREDKGSIIFTRQLRPRRNMPARDQSEQAVLGKPNTIASNVFHNNDVGSSRAKSPIRTTHADSRVRSRSSNSPTPLTPEQSPPSQRIRKRSSGAASQVDRDTDSGERSPAQSTTSSGKTPVHICYCQPDPKIPRPRNGKWQQHRRHGCRLTWSS